MLCWIEVDLDAVADNVRALQAAAEPRAGVTAVVKAQAYGMGASAVAQRSRRCGARGVAVARISEARRLRAAGFREPILLLGGMDADGLRRDRRARADAQLTDWATAERLADAPAQRASVLGVQVKVDTGMTRYGAPPDEAMAIVRGLGTLPEPAAGRLLYPLRRRRRSRSVLRPPAARALSGDVPAARRRRLRAGPQTRRQLGRRAARARRRAGHHSGRHRPGRRLRDRLGATRRRAALERSRSRRASCGCTRRLSAPRSATAARTRCIGRCALR